MSGYKCRLLHCSLLMPYLVPCRRIRMQHKFEKIQGVHFDDPRRQHDCLINVLCLVVTELQHLVVTMFQHSRQKSCGSRKTCRSKQADRRRSG